MPPHDEHFHLSVSFLRNLWIPNLLMSLRFSIMLILYFVRYLLSKCLRLSQGNFSHSKQNFVLFFLKNIHVFILQLIRVMGLLTSSFRQPGHLFFSLKCALHISQSIPQGAINSFFIFYADGPASCTRFWGLLFKMVDCRPLMSQWLSLGTALGVPPVYPEHQTPC